MKKAQATIFIVIAVLIIGGIVLLMIFENKKNIETGNMNTGPISSFTESCISSMGEEAVYYVAYTGGYYAIPNISTEENIAYFVYKENIMPSKEKIESELSNYMNDMLSICTNDFIDFPDFEIKQEKIETRTQIEKDKVIFNVVYPLTINKDNKTSHIQNFEEIEVPLRLGRVYNVSKEIVNEAIFNKDSICINCNLDLAVINDLYINIQDRNKTRIYTIEDRKSLIKNNPLTFNFAIENE